MTTQTYAMIDGSGNVVNTIISDGTFEAPEGYTLIAVGSSGAGMGWTYNNGVFTAPAGSALTLEQAQANQSALLSAACQNTILAGFSSSALGAAYTYPCKSTDQINLAASVIASQLPENASNNSWTAPFWCADNAGNWAMRNHTAAQIQQVGMDGYTAVKTQQLRLITLTGEVMAASTIAAVQAITW